MAQRLQPRPGGAAPEAGNYKVSGLQTDNLSVSNPGKDRSLSHVSYLTEAITKEGIVYETQIGYHWQSQNVQAMSLVQAGEIVKGGQQDRVLSIDMIVPAGPGKCPLPLFASNMAAGAKEETSK